jgi:hypothetical protein
VIEIEIILAIISSSGLCSIITACLTRHWNKKDKEDSKLDALIEANKLMMLDRIREDAKEYIAKKCITLEQKEHLKQLHEAYKALGGEDDADFLMKEVDKLPVSSDECP